MSRIIAQSVTADICARLFGALLFILLLPFILLSAAMTMLRDRRDLHATGEAELRGRGQTTRKLSAQKAT